ncbi:IS481 family transposase, partial [Saccharothrix algeriensis]
MLHRDAPLSVEGRHRLVQRCRTRPISHVAVEMGISRQCALKWTAIAASARPVRSTVPVLRTGSPPRPRPQWWSG